jgi:hypothetical protein
MGVGLKEIGAGLATAVNIKAAAHSRSISEQLLCEKEEFSVVRAVVREKIRQAPTTEEKAGLEAFDAMLFIGEYFLNLRNSTKSADLFGEVDVRAEAFIDFLKHFDDVWKHQLLDRSLLERAEHALASCVEGYGSVAA